MKGEGTKDRPNVNHLLDNICMNGQYLPISNLPITAISVTPVVAGYVSVNVDMLKKNNIHDIVFTAGSGVVGTAGMVVYLWDIADATVYGQIIFSSGEDNIIKSTSVKIYIIPKTGTLNFRTTANKGSTVGTSCTLNSSGINFYNKLPGTNI